MLAFVGGEGLQRGPLMRRAPSLRDRSVSLRGRSASA